MAFSPDGSRALSGGGAGSLRLWDLESGKEILKLEGHAGWVNSVAFSPDGNRALSGGAGGALRLWDLESGRLIRQFPLPGRKGNRGRNVDSVAISADGRRALSGGNWYDTQGMMHTEILLWEIPDEIGYWLLGTRDE